MANKKKKCCECIVNNNKKSAQITIHLISCHIELRRWKVMNHRVTWNAELFECVSTEWMSMSNNAIQFSEYEKEWGKMLIFDKSVSCYNVYVIAVSLSNDVLSVQVISNSFSFAFFYFIIVRCCWLCCPRFISLWANSKLRLSFSRSHFVVGNQVIPCKLMKGDRLSDKTCIRTCNHQTCTTITMKRMDKKKKREKALRSDEE